MKKYYTSSANLFIADQQLFNAQIYAISIADISNNSRFIFVQLSTSRKSALKVFQIKIYSHAFDLGMFLLSLEVVLTKLNA